MLTRTSFYPSFCCFQRLFSLRPISSCCCLDFTVYSAVFVLLKICCVYFYILGRLVPGGSTVTTEGCRIESHSRRIESGRTELSFYKWKGILQSRKLRLYVNTRDREGNFSFTSQIKPVYSSGSFYYYCKHFHRSLNKCKLERV